jgi:hypothetical protein
MCVNKILKFLESVLHLSLPQRYDKQAPKTFTNDLNKLYYIIYMLCLNIPIAERNRKMLEIKY